MFYFDEQLQIDRNSSQPKQIHNKSIMEGRLESVEPTLLVLLAAAAEALQAVLAGLVAAEAAAKHEGAASKGGKKSVQHDASYK